MNAFKKNKTVFKVVYSGTHYLEKMERNNDSLTLRGVKMSVNGNFIILVFKI